MSLFKATHTRRDTAEVYDAHADMLYRLALSYVQDPDDAQDVVQDVFMKYVSAAPVLKDREHERAWLIRVAANCCRDILRRRKFRRHVVLDEIADLVSDGKENAAEDALYVMNALNVVAEKNRAVLVLHYLEGFSVEEIARMLDLSLSAVKMRLARGREALKGSLEQKG